MSNLSIRVLVMDDSALMRRMVSDAISSVTGMEVVATSDDGTRIVELYERYKPNVVTLDIQMPKLDGLATLDLLMEHAPVPVVMVSSLTTRGAEITLEALDRGAVEYVAKPEFVRGNDRFTEEITRKVRIAASTNVMRLSAMRKARVERKQQRLAPKSETASSSASLIGGETELLRDKLIALGISTGGPPALTTLFESLRPPLPPIVIVQHMPPTFTKAFAKRLDSISALSVKEAETGDILLPNRVYIAPGGRHLEIVGGRHDARLQVREGDLVTGHKPSIDVMMQSAVHVFGANILGVMMTGMGRDGVLGCAAIRAAGGYVLGQDEATSDVYGMNKIAFNAGHVDRQFALPEGANELMRYVRKQWGRRLAAAR